MAPRRMGRRNRGPCRRCVREGDPIGRRPPPRSGSNRRRSTQRRPPSSARRSPGRWKPSWSCSPVRNSPSFASRASSPADRHRAALAVLRPLAALRLRPSNAWDDGSASLQDGSLAAASSRAQRPGPSGEAARRRPRGAGRRDLERAALMPEEGEGRAASQFRGRGPFDRNDGCATEWQTTLGEAHS